MISVSDASRSAHEDHDDVVCVVGTCQNGEARGCAADGARTFALAGVGTPCSINEVEGTCTVEGVCGSVR